MMLERRKERDPGREGRESGYERRAEKKGWDAEREIEEDYEMKEQKDAGRKGGKRQTKEMKEERER